MSRFLESNYKNISIELIGITPLLIHACTSKGISNKKRKMTDEEKANEWKKEIYLNKSGQLIMPERNLMACFLKGASGEKIGKNALRPLFTASITLDSLEPLILDTNDKPIKIDIIEKNEWLLICPVNIQKSKVIKTRTCLPNWKIIFGVNISKIEPQVTEKDLELVIEKAGRFAGLGVWRPSSPKPGRFGQFQLNKFEIM